MDKICANCKENKSIINYHRRGVGYQHVCKQCRKELDKQRWASGKMPKVRANVQPKYWKVCTICKKRKLSAKSFYKKLSRTDGLDTRCKDCTNEQNKAWIGYEDMRKYSRDKHLRLRYGITIGEYDELLAKQNGVCAICLKGETAKSKYGEPLPLAVDHDSKCCPTKKTCGKCIRGLLCRTCNQTLGRHSDNPEIFRRMADYIN